MVPVPHQSQHQRDRHHIHLAADRIGEIIQRQQRGQRGLHEFGTAGHGDHLPVQLAGLLRGLAGADEPARTGVDTGMHGLHRGRAGIDNMLVPQIDQMLRRREHPVLVVDADRRVETLRGRGVDADDRHMGALELPDLLGVHGERGHEHRIDVAAHRQRGEEVPTVLRGVDVLVERDVIPSVVHHRLHPGEHLRVEPAGDVLVHQQRHTVRLTRFQRRGRTGDVEVQTVGGFQHLAARLLGDQIGTGEGTRHRRDRYAGGLRHITNTRLVHGPRLPACKNALITARHTRMTTVSRILHTLSIRE